MKVFIISIILISAVYSDMAASGISKRGTTAAPFLEFNVGSRATAMGGAFTAIANDATTMYWNPAGIDLFTNNEVSFSYTRWIAGMDFIYAGAVLHTGNVGSFGVSVTSLSTPEMEVSTVEDPEGLGIRFDAADIALGVSYAISLTDRFSFGTSFKYIQRRIWHMSADAVAFDFGVHYTLPWEKVKFGMSLSNFGSKLQMHGVDALVLTDIDRDKKGNNESVLSELRTKEWSLPLLLRFGLSYELLSTENNSILISSDYFSPSSNKECINLGLEYSFYNFLMLRAGYQSLFIDDSEEGLTLGLGLKRNSVGVDYSYTKLKHLGDVQQFSAKIGF